MVSDTSAVLLLKLLLAIIASSALIIAASYWQLLGHYAVDALLGGVITAALVLVYPPPVATVPLTFGLWLASSVLAHLLARFNSPVPASALPSDTYALDIAMLEDLFEFEEVVS